MEMTSKEIAVVSGASLMLLYFATRKNHFTNEQHLNSLDPLYRKRFTGFISELKSNKLDPVIISSRRGVIKQAFLKVKDKRNAPPGSSAHNKRKAIDVQVKYKGSWLGSKTPKAVWISSGVPAIAKKYGLKWGGEIPGYYDPNHYEAV